MLLTISEN